MKLFGHPWSINTRKTLATIAEKGHQVPLTLVTLPKGEHERPEHLRVHPFGKVPVIDDDGFVLYETRAINAYIDATLSGPRLVPAAARERARMDQWINIADAYFIPFAHPLIVELLFRRYLGGEQNATLIAAGRTGSRPRSTRLTARWRHFRFLRAKRSPWRTCTGCPTSSTWSGSARAPRSKSAQM